MKKIAQLTMLLFLAVFATGCVSTGGYFADRGHDGADIFTATIGIGAGAKVRVGPLNTGLLFAGDYAGLRGGTAFRGFDATEGDFVTPIPLFGEWGPLCAIDQYNLGYARRKDFIAGSEGLPLFVTDVHGTGRNAKASQRRPYYFTQIEIVAGLGGTIRLGFNPGELLDFILGWTTIDIFNDDLERRKHKEKIEHKLELYQN